ncbi:MAG: type I restriction enzyme HsdR N-terminal domain-containing protein [Thermodesulfobacteriota bacterium]
MMNGEESGGSGCQDEGDEPQRLALFLIEEKGFSPADLETGLSIATEFNGEKVVSRIAMVAKVAGRRTMMLRYAPGSITTRERAAVAAARVLDSDYQIPLVVVTNGVEAVMLDTYKGKNLADSLAQLPTKSELEEEMANLAFLPLEGAKRQERERRILNAFDVDL